MKIFDFDQVKKLLYSGTEIVLASGFRIVFLEIYMLRQQNLFSVYYSLCFY
jgi:hypothetical protein